MAEENEANQIKSAKGRPAPAGGKKRQFKIEAIPETTRKRIFIVALTLIMLIIIISWLYSLKISLTSLKQETAGQTKEWQAIQGDLTNFLDNFKKTLESTKKQLNQISQPTTTPELSPADLERLKEEILELEPEKN